MYEQLTVFFPAQNYMLGTLGMGGQQISCLARLGAKQREKASTSGKAFRSFQTLPTGLWEGYREPPSNGLAHDLACLLLGFDGGARTHETSFMFVGCPLEFRFRVAPLLDPSKPQIQSENPKQ